MPTPQFVTFGGVDSRSNPVNLPLDRSLRCRNFAPKQDGHLELRWGYSTTTMSAVSVSAIHSMIPYTLWNGTKYMLFMQGTAWKLLALATGTVTTPTVSGTAIAASSKASSYQANNFLYIGNGTDQKWFDGTTLRDNGLRALTAAEVANVAISEGVREGLASERTSVTITPGASGSFNATVNGGYLFYAAYFDTTTGDLGPATQYLGSGRVVVSSASQKIALAVLPSLAAVNVTWVKLIARTGDGTGIANFCTNTSTALTSNSRSGTTLTVTAAGHGLSTGDIAILSGTTNFDGVYKVTVSDANTFTVTLQFATGANTAAGTVKRIVSVANATTTVDITATTQDTSYQVNADRGLPVSSVGGAQPGYQFYASIYNVTAGLHVGNRIAIGPRFKPSITEGRINAKFSSLPDLSGTNSEWRVLIGRTGDGAGVPYACADNSINWVYALSGQTSLILWQPTIDGDAELPTRNGIIPAACDKFSKVDDYIYAADSISSTIRRSGSLARSQQGRFVGDWAQAWAADDIIDFPTAEVPSAIAEQDGEVWVATANDSALAADFAGVLLWTGGPWEGAGCAGKRAWTKRGKQLFWVTGEKQLATFAYGEPVPVSDEYEAGLLAKIGDAYLSSTEATWEFVPSKQIDRLAIKCQDSSGNPFTVYHDFRLRDARSPQGQGYETAYVGPLATDFTIVRAKDGNGVRQNYAGASNGRIFQLNSGSTDGGTEFTGDYIGLINAGNDRLNVNELYWHGDQRAIISWGKTLSTNLSGTDQFQFEQLNPDSGSVQVINQENDFFYKVKVKNPQCDKPYIRIQLTSHSADGSLALSDPPHVPLENYGRIYDLSPTLGPVRPR